MYPAGFVPSFLISPPEFFFEVPALSAYNPGHLAIKSGCMIGKCRFAVAEQAKSEEVTESDAGAGEGGITEEMLYWLGNGMVASDSSELPESSFRLSEDSSQFLDPDGSVLVLQPADRMHIMEATLPGDSNFVDC